MQRSFDTRKPIKIWIVNLSLMLLTTTAVAEQGRSEYIPINRYLIEKVGATPSQVNPLLAVIHIQFPESIQKIGEAIRCIIEPQGFHLVSDKSTRDNQYILFNLPLPQEQRSLGPITLEEALSVLGGKSFSPVINPVTRSISYQLDEEYLELDLEKKLDEAWDQWWDSERLIVEPTIDPPKLDYSNDEIALSRPPAFHSGLDVYGPVQPGEILYQIAMNFKPDLMTVDQALVWLFTENPNAFLDNNMNNLKANALLKLPSIVDKSRISPNQASAVVKEHQSNWNETRQTR